MSDFNYAQMLRNTINRLQREKEALEQQLTAAEADWRRTSLCAEVRANADLRTKLTAAEAAARFCYGHLEYGLHEEVAIRNWPWLANTQEVFGE